MALRRHLSSRVVGSAAAGARRTLHAECRRRRAAERGARDGGRRQRLRTGDQPDGAEGRPRDDRPIGTDGGIPRHRERRTRAAVHLAMGQRPPVGHGEPQPVRGQAATERPRGPGGADA